MSSLARLAALALAVGLAVPAATPARADGADGPDRAAALEVVGTPAPAEVDAPRWPVRTGVAAALLGGAALLAATRALSPSSCRWCEPDGFDRRARGALRWHDTKAAGTASDVLQIAVPALSFGAVGVEAWRSGRGAALADDLSLLAEAEGAALLATEATKDAAGRLRPDAWARARAAGTRPDGHGAALASFWSGHTASAFAAASAAGTLAWRRGYEGWPWILGAGLAGAAACGYLRVAADRHWATDVLAGAAAGSLLGAGSVRLFEDRRPAADGGRERAGLRLAVVPFGVAGRF